MDFTSEFDLSDAAQGLAQDGAFLFDLEGVTGVLIVAASAMEEVRARRRHAVVGGLDHFNQLSAKNVGVNAVHPGADNFAGQHIWHKDNPAIDTRQTVSAIYKFFNSKSLFGGQWKAYPTVTWMIHMKARIFSGVQPSGNLHIGNYLGALKNWVEIQGNYESIFGIVDLHAVTVYQDPGELRSKILETAALFLAVGIDPKQSTIMVQSSVPEHSELAWMLTCVTTVGWLERMTQYKAKSQEQETTSDGLLQYPVLMAADILLYQAAIVPVGDDQAQHLELARDVAQRFNTLYGETFVMPATHLPAVGARIMGLDEPEKKMSKSASGSGHAVGLLDSIDQVRKKIMRATTDSRPSVDFETAEPPGAGVQNLLNIFQAFSGWPGDKMREHFSGMRYGDLKKQVAEMVIANLEPLQKRYQEIRSEAGYVDRVLREGAERVSPIAKSTVRLAKDRMGLYAGV